MDGLGGSGELGRRRRGRCCCVSFLVDLSWFDLGRTLANMFLSAERGPGWDGFFFCWPMLSSTHLFSNIIVKNSVHSDGFALSLSLARMMFRSLSLFCSATKCFASIPQHVPGVAVAKGHTIASAPSPSSSTWFTFAIAMIDGCSLSLSLFFCINWWLNEAKDTVNKYYHATRFFYRL